MTREEWLKWRHEGIGSSDAPVIMGMSPWKTRYQLWKEKISPVVDTPPNFIQRKGIEIEPKIRAWFELQMGKSFAPKLLMHGKMPLIRASLDGADESLTEICEIKLLGKDDFTPDTIPDKYWPQVQHQLFVSEARVCHFVGHCNGETKIISVKPEKEYLSLLFEKEMEFLEMIQRRIAPELSDGDYKQIKGFAAVVTKYKRLKAKIQELEDQAEAIKSGLIVAAQAAEHTHCIFNGLKVAKIERVGNINYKAIPELQGIDLEKYRGKPTSYWKVG